MGRGHDNRCVHGGGVRYAVSTWAPVMARVPALPRRGVHAGASVMLKGRGAAPLIHFRNRSPLADRLAEKSLPFTGSLRSRPFTIIALALASCATTHKLDVQQTQDTDRAAEVDVKRTTTTGPSVVLEFGPLETETAPPEGSAADRVSGSPARRATDALARTPPALGGLPPHGPLLKATFTGPSVEELTAIAKAQSHEHDDLGIKKQDESRPFGIFALLAAGWPFLLGACGAAALVVLKPAWIGIAFNAAKSSWSIVKSLFGKGK